MRGENLGGFPAHGLLFTSYKMQKICQGQKKVCAGTKVGCFPEKVCSHSVCLQLVLMGCVTGLDMQMLQRTAAKLLMGKKFFSWEESF